MSKLTSSKLSAKDTTNRTAATTPTPTPAVPTEPLSSAAPKDERAKKVAEPLSSTALKEERELAHDRQRAKKASDRAKGRKSTPAPRADKPKEPEIDCAEEVPNPGAVARFWSGVWAEAREKDEWEWPELPGIVVDFNGALIKRGEVALTDLIRPGKTQRKRKGAEADFEVIPHVRSVIVLDDCADVEELDEPWEYLSTASDESDGRKIFSYAEIASKAK
ncbi:hypothetical protein BV25DRAFT_1912695 [Artomyces pyxidatus]|uniref:Uncharacterized protein n=1 Tax=Artomyces pyxidatus TaxID=48021 RepID=A0ACB8TDY5_9AGAM|nr:hypothetical protein BV25DRAFT_1912695 [Artomyces pyxidatus]